MASEKEKRAGDWRQGIALYVHDLIYMLLAVMILFLVVFRVIVVTQDSMFSTLWDGDYLLLVSELFCSEPKQGDIVVISKQAFDDGKPIVKRVIATEGQQVDIDFDAGVVYVNGTALEESYTRTPTNLYEGVDFPLMVDEGCIFVMGDNRNESKDSRSPEIGQVDKREILGKAIFLFLPGKDPDTNQMNFKRIGALS